VHGLRTRTAEDDAATPSMLGRGDQGCFVARLGNTNMNEGAEMRGACRSRGRNEPLTEGVDQEDSEASRSGAL